MNRVYRVAVSHPYNNGARAYRHVALRARENGTALAHATGRVEDDSFRNMADRVEIVETYRAEDFNKVVQAVNKFNAEQQAAERPREPHTGSMMHPVPGALAP